MSITAVWPQTSEVIWSVVASIDPTVTLIIFVATDNATDHYKVADAGKDIKFALLLGGNMEEIIITNGLKCTKV